MIKCRECRPHIHEEMYWWCRLDEPLDESGVQEELEALCVSSGRPYAYCREHLTKDGKRCKPHWHFWVFGYRCEIRDWCRQYATAGGYMVKLADTQSLDCADGIVNYLAKHGSWCHDGIPDEVINVGLKRMESYKKERVSIYRQLDVYTESLKTPEDIIRAVMHFFVERDMMSSERLIQMYCETFLLKRVARYRNYLFQKLCSGLIDCIKVDWVDCKYRY